MLTERILIVISISKWKICFGEQRKRLFKTYHLHRAGDRRSEKRFCKTSSDNPISVGAALLTSLSIINPIVEQQKIQQAKDAQQSQIEAEQQVQLRAQEQAV